MIHCKQTSSQSSNSKKNTISLLIQNDQINLKHKFNIGYLNAKSHMIEIRPPQEDVETGS